MIHNLRILVPMLIQLCDDSVLGWRKLFTRVKHASLLCQSVQIMQKSFVGSSTVWCLPMLGTTTFSIMTFSIITLSITVSSAIMPSVTFVLFCRVSLGWVSLHWVSFMLSIANNHNAKCYYTECRGSQCCCWNYSQMNYIIKLFRIVISN